jgi:hypothetical protein
MLSKSGETFAGAEQKQGDAAKKCGAAADGRRRRAPQPEAESGVGRKERKLSKLASNGDAQKADAGRAGGSSAASSRRRALAARQKYRAQCASLSIIVGPPCASPNSKR